MWKNTPPEESEKIFSILLGLAFASMFFRHGLIHLVVFFFLLALLIYRPRLPWIAPFWWMLGFIVWEWLSNLLGPYRLKGIEGGGIGYHFIYLFLPLFIPVIRYTQLLVYITIGATASAILIWIQAIMGVNLEASPWRISWDGGMLSDRPPGFNYRPSDRPPGFNYRPWETQFIHSAITLVVLPNLAWKKARSWFLLMTLFTGVILPQIRAVIVAFIGAVGMQMMFKRADNNKVLLKRFLFLAIIASLCIGAIATLRPDFSKTLLSGNGRDKIFAASFHVFTQYPHTGVGGGEYFKKHYQQAWVDLGMHNEEKPHFLETNIGHPHSDALLLLAHHGWPALFLWTAFILHCLVFVWKYGNNRDRTLFISLVAFHHVAGLAETYLDYSNTTYTIFLCYGLALHSPIQRYKAILLNK